MSTISALYIFDEHHSLILDHVYTGRPPPPTALLTLYLQHPSPRPSLIHLTSTSPHTLLYSIVQDNLLFISPCTSDIEPLLVLEFLHRIADALEEFLGSPLLAVKITANYDVVAQVVGEIADGGIVCQTEGNALRDIVETGPGLLRNLLGNVGLPGSSGSGIQGVGSMAALQRPPVQSAQGSVIPWRRGNVRHTSNEMYVDIVETLSVTLAPSGRPLAAFAYGSIAFTSKVSGVPDLLLSLSTGGKGAGMGNRGDQLRAVMERAVFHPCVRLARWKTDGILSFVPPDGQFALCGYETDLLGPDAPLTTSKISSNSLSLPITVEMKTNLGQHGADFEVRLQSASRFSNARSAAAASLQSNLTRPGTDRSSSSSADSRNPAFENLSVKIPLPASVRNVSDLRPSNGEALFHAAEHNVEWRVPAKDLVSGSATLRCTIQGPLSGESDAPAGNGMMATTYDYDDEQQQPALTSNGTRNETSRGNGNGKVAGKSDLMPTSASLSFSIKGWLASGLKVESLLLDAKRSRGLGEGVKPYKGVKYLTVSREGVEIRC